MDEDLAFDYTCWKYIGTGTDSRFAAVLASTMYGQEALPDFFDTAAGRIWPPHVESDDDFGPPEYVDFEPGDFNPGP
ncbi:hypothetical protein PV396_42780 [Streptomyces sp. ME02-8801-2C]|uniref:hypothetical protein n=1 Tax=Streptomyces sp. ME02-8801-2C TaxID=3028680 RepID=UPI0029A86F95|nr:hypothetical protein [Streptomyces sp. ME02-8801-2C]MDX3458583.1 hypothetical protein [Streptomyces sp. ME02-8801-2C]